MLPVGGLEEVPPAEGEEVTAAFLRGPGDGRHRQGNAHELSFRILDEGDVLEVDHPQVGVHVTVDDIVRKHREIKELAIGAVDQVEDLPAVALLADLALGDPADMEVVALLHEGGCAGNLLGNLFGNEDAVFQPVIDLGESQGLKMVLVVREIVFQVEGADVVETFHDAAFIVEVRESERAGNLRHSVLFSESDDGIDQRLGNLLVVDEIDPAEADFAVVPVAVRDVVDDGGHTPDDFAFLVVSQELLALGVFSHRVLVHVQRGHLVHEQAGHIVRTVLVQFQREFHEGAQVLAALDGLDGYRHRSQFHLS